MQLKNPLERREQNEPQNFQLCNFFNINVGIILASYLILIVLAIYFQLKDREQIQEESKEKIEKKRVYVINPAVRVHFTFMKLDNGTNKEGIYVNLYNMSYEIKKIKLVVCAESYKWGIKERIFWPNPIYADKVFDSLAFSSEIVTTEKVIHDYLNTIKPIEIRSQENLLISIPIAFNQYSVKLIALDEKNQLVDIDYQYLKNGVFTSATDGEIE